VHTVVVCLEPKKSRAEQSAEKSNGKRKGNGSDRDAPAERDQDGDSDD
jgi:hypothetical protein